VADSPGVKASPPLAIAGNALSQAARPAVLLLSGIGYGSVVVGHLAATFSLVVLATVAIYPALGHSVLRHREGFAVTTGLVRRMAGVLLGSTLLLAVLLFADQSTLQLSSRVLPSPEWVLWILLLAPLTAAEQYALGLCSVAGALDRYSVAMLGSRIGLLVGAVALVLAKAPPLWMFALFALSSVVLLTQVVRIVGHPSVGPAPQGLRRDGLAAAPNAWAWFLMAQASILIVQALMGPREAGLFTVAYLLLNLPVLVLQGIALAWTSLASRRGPMQEWRRTRRLVPGLALAHLIVVLAAAALGSRFWPTFFGEDLAPAFSLLARMTLGAPGFALAYLFMPQWVSRGWFIRLSVIYMALALAYLGALARAAELGDLALVGWSTAGLGLALVVANLWAAWHWDRAALGASA
jgi:O-antigen/teichoic acid export membrane protein